MLAERKNLAALFLNRGGFGIHAQRQVGKGRDFEKLREYVPGDGYDEIHWKATAKRGRPITKVFQIERTQEVYVIIDSSRLSARTQFVRQTVAGRGSTTTATLGETTVLERFVTAALVLGLAAEQQGDLFGLLTFADRVGTFVRARNGQCALQRLPRRALHAATRFGHAGFRRVVHVHPPAPAPPRAAGFSDLAGRPAAGGKFRRATWTSSAASISCWSNMIQPPGVAPLFSSPDATTPDDLFRHLGGHLLWQKLRDWKRF